MDICDRAFEEDPLDDEVGRLWRRVVLKRRGSQGEMEILVQFLGRKLISKVFCKSLVRNCLQNLR